MIGEISFPLHDDEAKNGFNEFLFSKQNNLQVADFEIIQQLLLKSDIFKTTDFLTYQTDEIIIALSKVKNYIQSICDTVSENMLMNGKLIWKVFYLDLMTLYVYYFKQYLMMGLNGTLNILDSKVCETLNQEFFEILQTTQRVEVVSSNKVRKIIHALLYKSDVCIKSQKFRIFQNFLDMSLLLASSPLHVNYFIDSIDFQMFDDGEYQINISKGSLIHKFAKFWLLEQNELKEKISSKFQDNVTEQFLQDLNVLQFAKIVFQVDDRQLLYTILKNEENKSIMALVLVYKWKVLMSNNYWVSRIQDINSLYLLKFEFDFEERYNYYLKRIQVRVFQTLETPLIEQANDFENFRLWVKCLVDSVYFKLKTDTDYIKSSSYQIFENNYLEILDDLIFYIKNDMKQHKFEITKLIYESQLTFIRFIVLLSDCEHGFQNQLSKVLQSPSKNNQNIVQEAVQKLERLRQNHLFLLLILISKEITIPIKSIQYFGLLNFNKEELAPINEYLLNYIQNIIDQTPLPLVVYGGQQRRLNICESYIIFKSLFNQLDEKSLKNLAIQITQQIIEKFPLLVQICENNYDLSFTVCRIIKKVFHLTEYEKISSKHQMIVLDIISFFLKNNFTIPTILNNNLLGQLQQSQANQITLEPSILQKTKQLFILTQINTNYLYLKFHSFPPFTLEDFKEAYELYYSSRIEEKKCMEKLFIMTSQYDSNFFTTYFRIRQSKYQMEIGVIEKMVCKGNSKLTDVVNPKEYNDFLIETNHKLCELSYFSTQIRRFSQKNNLINQISREEIIEELRQFFIKASFSQIKLLLNVQFQDKYFINYEVAHQLKEVENVLKQLSVLKMIMRYVSSKDISQKGDITESFLILIEFLEKFYHDEASMEFQGFISKNLDLNQLCKQESIKILIALSNELTQPALTQYTILQMMHFLASFFNQYCYSGQKDDESTFFKDNNPQIIECLKQNVDLITINNDNINLFIQNAKNLVNQLRYYSDNDVQILDNQHISTKYVFLNTIYFLMNILNICQNQNQWNTQIAIIYDYIYSIICQDQKLILKIFTLKMDLTILIGPYKLYSLESSLLQVLRQEEKSTLKIIQNDVDLFDVVYKITQEKNIFNNLLKSLDIEYKILKNQIQFDQKFNSHLLNNFTEENKSSFFNTLKLIYNEFKIDQESLKEELEVIEILRNSEIFQEFQLQTEQKVEVVDDDMNEWEDYEDDKSEDSSKPSSQKEDKQSNKEEKQFNEEDWEEYKEEKEDESSLSRLRSSLSGLQPQIEQENENQTPFFAQVEKPQVSQASQEEQSSESHYSEHSVHSENSSSSEKYKLFLNSCMPLYEIREKQAVAKVFQNKEELENQNEIFQNELKKLQDNELKQLIFLDEDTYKLTNTEKPNLFNQIKNVQDLYQNFNITNVNVNIISSSEEEDDDSSGVNSSGLQGSEGDYADVEIEDVSIEELENDEDRYPTFGAEVDEKSFVSQTDTDIQPLRTFMTQKEEEYLEEKKISIDQIQYPTRLFLSREYNAASDLIDLKIDGVNNKVIPQPQKEKNKPEKSKKKQKKPQKEEEPKIKVNMQTINQDLHYFLFDKFYWTEAYKKKIEVTPEYEAKEKAIQKFFLKPKSITIESVQIITTKIDQLLTISKGMQLNNVQQAHIRDTCFFLTFLFHKNQKCKENFKKRILNSKNSSKDQLVQSMTTVVLQSCIQWGDYMQSDNKFTVQFALELLKEAQLNEQILKLVLQLFLIPEEENISKQKIIKILQQKFQEQPKLENIFLLVIIDQYENLISQVHNMFGKKLQKNNMNLDNLTKMSDITQDKKLIYCQLAFDEPIQFNDKKEEILVYYLHKLWKLIRIIQQKICLTLPVLSFMEKLVSIFPLCELLFQKIKIRPQQYYDAASLESQVENISRTLKRLFRCFVKLSYQVLANESENEIVQIDEQERIFFEFIKQKTTGIETVISNMIGLDESFIKLYIAFFIKTNSDNLSCTSINLRLEFCWQSTQDILLEKDQHEDEINNEIHRGKEFTAWSYHLMKHQIIEVLGRDFNTSFYDENGADQGGLTQDFITHFVKLVMDPRRGLFRYTPLHHKAFISNSSHLISDNLTIYACIGLFIAKFQINNYTLALNLTQFTINFLFDNCDLTIEDMEEYDPEVANHLNWILNNDVTDLGMTFEISDNSFGLHSTKEIIPNGSNIHVTNENKQQYVDSYIKYKLYDQVKDQVEAFRQGFKSGFPKLFHQIFSFEEFKLMFGNQALIDIQKLRKHITYEEIEEDSEIIRWFWEILEDMPQDELSQLLYFITGFQYIQKKLLASYQIPVGGYELLGVTIYYQNQKNQLPISHTCSNQLDIFEYQSKQEFKEKLYMAMTEGNGFGFA